MKLYQEILYQQIKKGARVLDLGCGDGQLLDELINKKKCYGYGIEKDYDNVLTSIGKGIPTYQGDILEGLQQFGDHAFDIAILSQTLQQVMDPVRVMDELCRVSKMAIVTFPNFGYWKVRAHLFFTGTSPKTAQLPYNWHDTPNIRVVTIKEFKQLCREKKIKINKEIPLMKFRLQRAFFPLMLTNILTEKGIFIISK